MSTLPCIARPTATPCIEDVQGRAASRAMPIDKVGIKNVHHPVRIKDRSRGKHWIKRSKRDQLVPRNHHERSQAAIQSQPSCNRYRATGIGKAVLVDPLAAIVAVTTGMHVVNSNALPLGEIVDAAPDGLDHAGIFMSKRETSR